MRRRLADAPRPSRPLLGPIALFLAIAMGGPAPVARADDPTADDASSAALARWIERLPGDANETGPATSALVRAGAVSVEPLRRALMDGLAARRLAAARALGRIGASAASALPALVGALEDDDAATRAEAARAIERIGTPEGAALESLEAKLLDPDDNVRRVALGASLAAGEAGRRAFVRAFAEHETRDLARRALAALGARALPALLALLSDPSWSLRAEAASRLAALGPLTRPHAAALVAACRDESAAVRATAVAALYASGDRSDDALGVFLGLAHASDPGDRAAALLVLGDGRFDATKTRAAIAAATTDADARVRLAAAVASLYQGPPERSALLECVAALERAGLPAPYPTRQRNLRAGGAGAAVVTLPTVSDVDAFEALRAAGAVVVVPVLGEALSAPAREATASVALVRALWQLLPSESPTFLALLAHADPAVRTEAALCLAPGGDHADVVVPVLVAALRRGDRPAVPAADAGAVELALASLGAAAARALGAELDAARADAPPRTPHVPPGSLLRILAEMGPDARDALPAIDRTLGDEDSGALWDAASAAAKAIRATK